MQREREPEREAAWLGASTATVSCGAANLDESVGFTATGEDGDYPLYRRELVS